jgi:hypothetical protein
MLLTLIILNAASVLHARYKGLEIGEVTAEADDVQLST